MLPLLSKPKEQNSLIVFFCMVISTFLQPPTASVSTHILDISLGRPAEGVTILAYVEEGGQWKLIGNRSTTADGRVPWVSPNVALTRANYKLQFMIGNYYEKLSIQTFYPYVEALKKAKSPKRQLLYPS
ncbi:hypothetical protein Angca_003718 [Angiostrongylus cantonensis]|nr:hypothetical protein Angca_003718 [Angiostrongylus cantonensis]